MTVKVAWRSGRGGWKGRARRATCSGSVLLCTVLCSCMSVMYDLRDLEQPVTMNGNPFVCAPDAAPSLRPIDGYVASVSKAVGGASSSMNTTSMDEERNEAQARAFEKIGGDASLAITDVRLDAESLGVFLLTAIMASSKVGAMGAVQQIDRTTTLSKEEVQ
jgi:hypothetical protein